MLLLMYSGLVLGAAQNGQVQKVFHHQALIKSKPEISLELGKLVFYFDQVPDLKVQCSKNAKTAMVTCQYVVSGITQMAPEAQEAIAKIDGKSYGAYKIFIKLNEPKNQLVVDLSYNPEKVYIERALFDAINLSKGLIINFYNKELLTTLQKNSDVPLLKTAQAKQRPCIVLDCGHGGTDDGTIGHNQLKEKDLALALGKRIAQLLKKEGCAVFLTRSSDEFVALDERTTRANAYADIDLFLSIHANHSPNAKAQGIETFCMKPDLLKTAYEQRNPLLEALDSQRYTQARLLANCVQGEVIAQIQSAQKKVTDRSVKYAVSQVLVGSRVPAALIEVGFLSHEQEAQQLADRAHQQLIEQGICKGILKYLATNKLKQV